MTDLFDFDFTEAPVGPPSGNPRRFADRWHFIGGGLSNVWRYGDLDLPAPTGRLLLRGPNGTGKTTALEALWPYLLDLDSQKLVAGKARTTTLKQLMSEGAEKTGRRYGYAWLSFEPPAGADEPSHVTYGVRLQYSPSASPAVKVVPFTVPARPVRDFALTTGTGAALEHDTFSDLVGDIGGDVFDSGEEYVEHLAGRIWGATAQQVKELAQRMRQVRNPALLGDLSVNQAADALRDALPGVAADDITATADALAESKTTREAFERNRQAAQALGDFARIWAGHVTDAAVTHLRVALAADDEVTRLAKAFAQALKEASDTAGKAEQAEKDAAGLAGKVKDQEDILAAIEQSAAYKTAGAAAELAERLRAERGRATSETNALRDAAAAAARDTQAAEVALDTAAARLTAVLEQAAATHIPVPAADTLLSHHSRPRQVRTVADIIANPGSGLTVRHDDPALDALATGWASQSNTWRADAGAATSLRKAHLEVAKALDARAKAEHALHQSEEDLRREHKALGELTATAKAQAAALLGQLAPWTEQQHRLRLIDPHDPDAGLLWDADDLRSITDAEPAAVLAQTGDWAAHALTIAEQIGAAHESQAREHTERATALDTGAAELRVRARKLRGGELLPFPRPGWAGPGDDATSFGTVLEWQPDIPDPVRNRVEAALAASGLLAAHLDRSTTAAVAATTYWRVTAAGHAAPDNLTAVLTVDPTHPSAAAARAVLIRIGLADTAGPAGTALVIGRDGTYTAGVLTGDTAAAAAAQGQPLSTAEFVGARTRRARALAEADRLDADASRLNADAAAARTAADTERGHARSVRAAGRSFPAHRPLENAEGARAGAALRAADAKATRDGLEAKVSEAVARHQRVHNVWTDNARALGLPADVAELDQIATGRRARADALDGCVRTLRAFTATLPRTVALPVDEDELASRLATLEDGARGAHQVANSTEALLEEVRRDTDAADALRRHADATGVRDRLSTLLTPALEAARRARSAADTAAGKVDPAREAHHDALPAQAATASALSALLNWPPAAAALDVPAFQDAAGRDPQIPFGDGDTLLTDAVGLLEGKPTSARRTLNDRYDEVRAALAQTWTLAHGEAPDGITIDTFVLTHADEQYDPPRAARRATELAAAAEAALAAADEKALRDLVIGRLPTAIGLAWQRMHDWKNEVNAKMHSAQASSGVGVQVRITLREDLDPAACTVHRLSCDVSAAVRTEQEKRQVGDAIQALLAAADGDTMTDRLTAAIDIRSWVDVRYLVERPAPDGTRTSRVWGPRTGLSGGERRLVVLAPMLAAIAAGYDRLGPSGARLVPLDEVPAEVDEQGREGLARYLADLDLDLICTSYLWDGAPGAWDGIDGHDLEAGSGGTVVAFPTVIRAFSPIPDDVLDPQVPAG